MIAIQTPREPCIERYIAALAAVSTPDTDAVDATVFAFTTRTAGRVRPVKLIQHPSFVRAADLGPDPRFTLAGRASSALEQVSRAA